MQPGALHSSRIYELSRTLAPAWHLVQLPCSNKARGACCHVQSNPRIRKKASRTAAHRDRKLLWVSTRTKHYGLVLTEAHLIEGLALATTLILTGHI